MYGKRTSYIWKSCLVVIAISVLSFLELSCTKSSESDSDRGSVKVGAILPLTGDAATYGESCQRGMKVAEDRFDLSIAFEDGAAKAKTSVSAFKKLVGSGNAKIVLGGMFSEPTLAFGPIARQKNVLVLSPTSGSSKVPKIGNNVFSLYPRSSEQGEYMAKYLKEKYKSETLKIAVVNAKEQVYIDIASGFKNEIKSEKNMKLKFSQEVSSSMRSFRNIISKIKNESSTSHMFLSGGKQFVTNFIKQARQLGYEGKFLSQSTLYDKSLLKSYEDALEGVTFSGPYFRVEGGGKRTEKFVRTYKSKYNTNPNVWSAYCYDTVMTIKEAVSKCKECGVKSIQDTLYSIKANGLTGPIGFNKLGGAERSFKTYTIEGDSFKTVER